MRSIILATALLFVPLLAGLAQEKKDPAHTITIQVGGNRPYYADYFNDRQGKPRLGNIREYDLPPAPFSGNFLDQGQVNRMTELLAGDGDPLSSSSLGVLSESQLARTMRMLDPFSGSIVDDRLVRAAAVNWLTTRDLNQWLVANAPVQPNLTNVHVDQGASLPVRGLAARDPVIREPEPKPKNEGVVPVGNLKVRLKEIREEAFPRKPDPKTPEKENKPDK